MPICLPTKNCTRARLGQVIEERAEEAHGAELNGNAEAHVVAAAGADEGLVGVVEVEVAREMVGRWLTCEPAVPALLLVGQEADRHGDPFPGRPLAADGHAPGGAVTQATAIAPSGSAAPRRFPRDFLVEFVCGR